MNISELGPLEALKLLMPHVVAAGELACRIQDDIPKNGNRNGDAKKGDRFVEALTDADIAVETYLAIVLLNAFEDVSFYGEEYERDRVSPYFPKDRPYLVTLDPIDGTLYFKDGLPLFATVLTICKDMAIVAALAYVPRERRFYLATDGEGAFTTTAEDIAAGKPLEPFTVAANGRIVLLGADFLHRKDAFEAAGYSVANPSRDYDGSKEWNRTTLRMLTGEVAGVAYGKAQLIDAGAFGYLVSRAGGADNGPVYDASTMRAEPLIVATSPETYAKMAELLRG